ncbi:hypothetical protein ABZ942_03725 [Nocardia sp. NPDC046473]|uniref:hypothetical protein n=1 Tax=Nocardia sp. NPDC046473 TaxID=3155733 RepID=UPI0033C36A40
MKTPTFDNARAVVWAGRLIALLGAGHTVGALILTRDFLDDWLSGELWDIPQNLGAPQPMVGAFFVSVASFGVPLLLLGVAISRMGRHGVVPSPLLAWGVAAWITVCDLVGGPSPLLLAWISIVTLLIAARRHARRSASALGQPSPQIPDASR